MMILSRHIVFFNEVNGLSITDIIRGRTSDALAQMDNTSAKI